ncbi:MAG: E3 binding domain-containing protein, partial [Planctomycetes bacterium]|nr:E3 binding domain-containing protein [Planctomycetota bacterium]
MPDLIRVPYLGTAEEDVLLATWLVAEGESFRKGDALAAVETLKAAFEIEAERDGVLHRQVVPAGERVAVQGVVGIARGPAESVSAGDEAALLASVEVETEAAAGQSIDTATRDAATRDTVRSAPASVAGEVDAAPAARLRARELGIDLAAVRGTGGGGLIRLEDVERHVAAGGAAAPAADPAAGDGWLSADFTELLDRDRAAFAALGSASKVAIYRRFGARLGADVSFGSNAVIRARRLVLGDGSHVGENVTIDCEELVAGKLACFGRNSVLRSRRIELGDNAFFAPDVEVGGGGAMEPEAELVVGSNGFIGERSHLNPCRRLEIGDEVVISRSAVVMTHSFGGSVLDGYPNRFAPVRIGSRCQVGIGAMLFPGVEMGEGSILLSNSTLVTSMPAGRMFAGVPATDLRAAAHAPSE